MIKKHFKVGCVIGLVILLFSSCGTANQDISKETPECQLLVPMESPVMLPNERDGLYIEYPELDFTEKTNIIYGKYGFRYTLKTDESIVLRQEVLDDVGLDHVTFGIYEDEELRTPISEIHMADVRKMNHKFEMGEADREDYPDFREWNEIALEPGIYYLAVYSTSSKEQKVVSYECQYGVIKDEILLKEGKWGFFFSAGKEQDTYFEIEVESPGTLVLSRELGMDYKIWLCDEKQNPIKEVNVPKGQENRAHCKAETYVSEPGTYFLKVNTKIDGARASCYEIKYEMKQETSSE